MRKYRPSRSSRGFTVGDGIRLGCGWGIVGLIVWIIAIIIVFRFVLPTSLRLMLGQ